jgi:hypothetical protein
MRRFFGSSFSGMIYFLSRALTQREMNGHWLEVSASTSDHRTEPHPEIIFEIDDYHEIIAGTTNGLAFYQFFDIFSTTVPRFSVQCVI